MKSIVLKYGLISGLILGAMTAVTIPLCMNGVIDFERSEVVGYASMVLSFILVFIGIRSYREKQGGGAITFGRAFKVGILITLVTCAVYVVSWQIVYFGFIPDFDEKYAAFTIEKLRAGGASPAELDAESRKMDEFRRLYANPLFNVAMTFMEVFPVGLIVTLVSAGILRRKAPPVGSEPAAALA